MTLTKREHNTETAIHPKTGCFTAKNAKTETELEVGVENTHVSIYMEQDGRGRYGDEMYDASLDLTREQAMELVEWLAPLLYGE